MWICIAHVIAAPIMKCATNVPTKPVENAGIASRNPTKKTTAAGSKYEGLMMCVENCSVQGIVNSQPHTSHFGTEGTRRHTYTQNSASAANDSRFSRTKGAS